MIERKYLAHYIDAAFSADYSGTDYVRLGDHLEEYSEELNPDYEVTKNIKGEQSVQFRGYEAQSSVDPFYSKDYDDALSNKILEIINERQTGDKVKTSIVDVFLKPSDTPGAAPTVVYAYREDAYVIPRSKGGDTSGIQTPFDIINAGNRVKGTFDLETSKFTAGTASGEALS